MSRLQSVSYSGQLGYRDEAVPIFMDLMRSERVAIWVQEYVIEALGRLKWFDVLLILAGDEHTPVAMREQAATALEKLGHKDEAASIWLTLARDARVTSEGRTRMIGALKQLGRADVLLIVSLDTVVTAWVRIEAAGALGQLGYMDEATSCLLALALSIDEFAWIGHMRIVEILHKLSQVDALLVLARNEHVDDAVRCETAAALGQLGRVNAATEILLTLVNDKRIDAGTRVGAAETLDQHVYRWVRCDAARKLGQYGDARVLPDIDKIAQSDLDEDVRDAAREATIQIRSRFGIKDASH